MLVISLGIPSMNECARASDHAEHPAAQADEGHGDDEADSIADEPATGLKLGEFRIRGYYPIESQKCAVTFTLYANVPDDKRDRSRQLFLHRRHKVRDQVILAARLVPLAQFDEPDLASFRRRIVIQLRRAVPELSIDDVYVSDFNMQLERI